MTAKPVEIEILLRDHATPGLETMRQLLDTMMAKATTAQERAALLSAAIAAISHRLQELRQAADGGPDLDQAANVASIKRLEESLGELKQQLTSLDREAQAATAAPRGMEEARRQYNGLHNSIQQIAREMPSLAMGPQMFFLAISNNLPIFADELARARQEYQALTQQGQKATPVWRQVLSSLLSWQTALTTGIMLLVMYGDQIVSWIGNLFKGKDALEDTRQAQERFAQFQKKMNNEWRQSVANTAGENIAAYRKLASEYGALGDSMEKKRKFVCDNQDEFHKLGFSVNGVTDAENLFVRNTDAVVNALVARAKAAAYEQTITKATQRYIEQTEYNKGTVKGGGYYSRATAGRYSGLNELGGNSRYKSGAGKKISVINPDDLGKLTMGVDYTDLVATSSYTSFTLTAAGAAKVNAQRQADAAKKLQENNERAKKELDKVVKAASEGIKQQTEAENAVYDNLSLKRYGNRDGAGAVKAAEREAGKREKAEENVDKNLLELRRQNQESDLDLMKDGTEKQLAEIKARYEKQRQEIDRQAADMAKANQEAGIDGLNVQGLTQEQQVELDKAYRLAGEARQASIDETNRQELQAMDEYLAQYGSFQQRKESIARQAAQEIRDIEASTYDEGEKRWRVRAVRERAERETADVEAEAVTARVDWYQVFGNLGGIMTSAMRPMLEELKAYTRTDDFQRLGAERQQRIVEAMGSMRSMMGDNTDLGWRDLAADLTDYQQALREAMLAQRELEQKERSQAATLEELRKAMEKASAEGDEEAYSEVKGQYDTIMLDLADSGRQVAKANDKVRTSGTKLAQTTEAVAQPMDEIHAFLSTTGLTDLQVLWDSFNQLRGGVAALKALNEAGKNVGYAGEKIAEGAEKAGEEVANSLGDGLSKAGIIGQIVAAILKILDVLRDGIGPVISSLIDSILGAINGLLDNILSGQFISQIVGSLVKGVGNIVDTIIGALGSVLSFGALSSGGPSEWFGGSNAERVMATIDRLSERNELLRQSIEDLTDTIEGGEGTKSVEAYQEAVRLQEEANRNYLEIARAQAGYAGSHHSWNYYWGGFTQEEIDELSRRIGRQWSGDLFDLSPEEMKELRGMVDTWERMQQTGEGGYGYRLTERLDDYIEQAGQMEELTDQLNESLTQVSFDSMYDSFVDTLMDMEASAEDMADSLSEYFMRALLANQLGETYKDRLRQWYDQFAEAMGDNDLSEEELEALSSAYGQIVDDAVALRDQLAQATGYEGSQGGSSQSGKAGGFLAMSQDQGTKLEGLFTSLQMHAASIDGRMLDVSEQMGAAADSLRRIEENTGNSARHLGEIKEDIKKIIRDGLKVK